MDNYDKWLNNRTPLELGAILVINITILIFMIVCIVGLTKETIKAIKGLFQTEQIEEVITPQPDYWR
jgi:hypothetical protein